MFRIGIDDAYSIQYWTQKNTTVSTISQNLLDKDFFIFTLQKAESPILRQEYQHHECLPVTCRRTGGIFEATDRIDRFAKVVGLRVFFPIGKKYEF